MLEPEVSETNASLTVSASPWLRLACAFPFVLFFCGTVCALMAPVVFITGGSTPEMWGMSIAVAVLSALPTALFWHGVQPSSLKLHFDDGCYELRRGFGHFVLSTSGRFSEIDRLVLWNERKNRADVSYTTSLRWKMKRLPFQLRVTYNDPDNAVDWATQIAEKLNVPLDNKIRK